MVNSYTQPRVCLKIYESIINSPINPITVSALHDAQHIHVTCYILIGKQTVSLLFSFWSDFEQWKSLGYAKTVFVVGFGDSRAFRHMESWRSHTSHAGTQRHIYHCAKGQMLMVISHPILASRAVTLSCWLSPTLLMTKLLPILPQNPQHSVAATPWGSCGLTRRKNMEGGGELAGVSGSQWPRLKTKNRPVVSTPPGMPCFHFMAHTRHEHMCMPAPRQQWAAMLAVAGLSMAVGEPYPAVRVYSLQGRGAEYLSFRWMIKWVAQQEVKQLEFLPHYHGNLISGIMRY